MDEPAGASLPGSDAELLNTIRSGDPGAFAVLRGRHEAAARRLAGLLADGPEAADALVAGAFSQVLEDITRGDGPSDAFCPYLLAAVEKRSRITGPGSMPPVTADPGVVPADSTVAGGEPPAVAASFFALPERWQAVLWHADVEGDAPEAIGPLVGLAAADVPALTEQARDGLDREYRLLQSAAEPSEPTGLAGAVGVALRRDVAPLYLGAATAGYLAGRPGAAAGPATDAAAGAGLSALPSALPARLAARLRDGSPPLAVFVAGAAVVLAIVGIAVYLLTLSPAAGPVSAAGSPTSASPRSASPGPTTSSPGPVRTTRTTSHQGGPKGQGPGTRPGPGTGTGGPTGSPPPGTGSSAPTTTAPVSSPPPSGPPPSGPPTSTPRPAPSTNAPSPRPKPSPSRPTPPSARVSAQVNVFGSGPWGHIAVVSLGVSNSGPATTSALNASVTLPSGTQLLTGWPSPPAVPGAFSLTSVPVSRDGLSSADGNGWNCRAAAGGAACAHPAIAASTQAVAHLVVRITNSSACGRHVQVRVTGGASPASAASEGTIQCGRPHTTRKPTHRRRTRRPGSQPPSSGRNPAPRGGWPGDPRHHWRWPWPGWHWPGGHWPWPGQQHYGWPRPG